MRENYLKQLIALQKRGEHRGIYSVCSANEYVLTAAMERAKQRGIPVLIEATANQVNQFGGYTGMLPEDFYLYCLKLSKQVGLAEEQLILGGDHLGPLIWQDLCETQAMEHAEELVREFVRAGFSKIHLDTSMRVADDDPYERLSDETIARRGARLCAVAERTFAQRTSLHPDASEPVYVIGSEVPIPGGAQEGEESITVTSAQACKNTISAFQKAYVQAGLEKAWQRVVAVVVQPGVEFGDEDVFAYDREKARELCGVLRESDSLVFEGHSTDYQTRSCLNQMVEDGIAILKVGPALTFALREGLFALEHIEKVLLTGENIWLSGFSDTLEAAMLHNDGNWKKHYHGDGVRQAIARKYSMSDRARYYLNTPKVQSAVERLIDNLQHCKIPLTLISQYMPNQYAGVREGRIQNDPEALLKDRICNCIDEYLFATAGD